MGKLFDATSEQVTTFAKMLRARAAEGENLGTMPPDVAEAGKRSGLFMLALPRSLGGLELDPLTIISIIEELSRADGSGGWTTAISNNSVFFAWLEPGVAKEILGENPRIAATCMFTPTGRAAANGSDNSFSVSGRWPFSSGCMHADWFQAGSFVTDSSNTPVTRNGRADYRFVFFPSSQAEIIPTWDALGLRGTGSHSISAKGLTVDEAHTAAMFFEEAPHGGPLWRIPAFTLAGIFLAGFPLGVASRALEEFRSLALSRVRQPATQPLAHEPECQLEYARCEAVVRAARSLTFDYVGRLWEIAQRGDVPDVAARADVLLAVRHAMHSCTSAVDSILQMAGARAVAKGNALERCFRDIHTGAQHVFFGTDAAKRFSRSRFGIEQETFMI